MAECICGWGGEGPCPCPNNPLYRPRQPAWPGMYVIPQPLPQGCVCPPTSEKTCENPTCPRKARST